MPPANANPHQLHPRWRAARFDVAYEHAQESKSTSSKHINLDRISQSLNYFIIFAAKSVGSVHMPLYFSTNRIMIGYRCNAPPMHTHIIFQYIQHIFFLYKSKALARRIVQRHEAFREGQPDGAKRRGRHAQVLFRARALAREDERALSIVIVLIVICVGAHQMKLRVCEQAYSHIDTWVLPNNQSVNRPSVPDHPATKHPQHNTHAQVCT